MSDITSDMEAMEFDYYFTQLQLEIIQLLGNENIIEDPEPAIKRAFDKTVAQAVGPMGNSLAFSWLFTQCYIQHYHLKVLRYISETISTIALSTWGYAWASDMHIDTSSKTAVVHAALQAFSQKPQAFSDILTQHEQLLQRLDHHKVLLEPNDPGYQEFDQQTHDTIHTTLNTIRDEYRANSQPE